MTHLGVHSARGVDPAGELESLPCMLHERLPLTRQAVAQRNKQAMLREAEGLPEEGRDKSRLHSTNKIAPVGWG
jgi:hypothetical protein